jgi:hypothetical protein|tara:strand:+ start:854 stop:1099 length:246 start_codon:yes stop_codon:yes gene_type:complete
MARRKIGNSHTTISIRWEDKEKFRKFAKFVKKTKTGDLYESDSVLFARFLEFYINGNQQTGLESHSTYPTKPTSQEQNQQS